jgi:alcohol dehydrogenase (cytochrome c)
MKLCAVLVFALITGSLQAQVTFHRLLHADQEPQNWLMYGGNYSSHGHSLLTQVNTENVKNLQLKWVWRSPSSPEEEKMECEPVEVNGVLYATTLTSVVALDAVSGRQYWKFERPFNENDYYGQRMYMVNKGVAVADNMVFWTTGWDDHLIALDASTGRVKWEVPIADWKKGYVINMTPMVVKNEVIVGPTTDDRGANCFLAAYDLHTGKELWKFYTAPMSADNPVTKTWGGETWKHGGDGIWNDGAYDPETNLVFYGTANANPAWNGSQRSPDAKLDNLYSECVIALDADTGKLKWYYQFTPEDEYDWDATQVPVLADIDWQGKPRKVMLFANRNGFFYVLDRVTGKFLLGKPFTKVNWASGIDKDGRPILNPKLWPKPKEGAFVSPSAGGGTNYYPPSYDPQTGLFYLTTAQNSGGFSGKGVSILPWKEGHLYTGSIWWPGFGQTSPPANWPPMSPRPSAAGGRRRANPAFRTPAEGYGAIDALVPQTGEKKWEFKLVNNSESGVLSTAGGVVFAGGRDGIFFALDAQTGKPLWHVNVSDGGGGMASGPMSYAVNGKQYVVTTSDNTMYGFALPD